MEQYEVFFLGVSEQRRCSKVPLLLVSNLSNQWGLSQASAIQKPSSEILLRRTTFWELKYRTSKRDKIQDEHCEDWKTNFCQEKQTMEKLMSQNHGKAIKPLRWCHWHQVTEQNPSSSMIQSQITFQSDHSDLCPFNTTYRVTSCCIHYQLSLNLNCVWTVEVRCARLSKGGIQFIHKYHSIVFTSNMYKKYQLPCLVWDFLLSHAS